MSSAWSAGGAQRHHRRHVHPTLTATSNSQVSQPAKTKLNASLIYTDPGDRWSVTVYGKNLANKTYISNAFVSSSIVGFGVNGFLEEPRTYGVTIGYKF